jgi:hypothetical protein
MKNGDHFTCEIKRLEEGVLYASFDYVDGTISIDWSKIARVESTQLFIVLTQSGSTYLGTLKTSEIAADQPIKIEIFEVPAKEKITIPPREVVDLQQGFESFWRRFSGSFSSGIIYSKSNSNTQYNLGAELKYLRARWSAQASYSSALSSTTGTTTSTRNELTLQGQRLLPRDNWFYSGLGDFLQSSQQGIQIQSTVGGGIGRFLKNTNRTRISLTGGLAWQGTKYIPSSDLPGTQNLIAGVIATNVQAFKFKKTKLDLSALLFPALSEPGRVRFNTHATYSIEIFSNFWWNFTFYGNWDNRPPANLSGSDYGASSGISWSFP